MQTLIDMQGKAEQSSLCILLTADPDNSYALGYDSLNRVVSVAGPFGVTQTFGYDAADNRVTAADNMGTVTTSGYDHLNRLTSRSQAVGGVNVLKADWTYDSKGDRTAASRSSWTGSAWAAAGSSAYTFDDLGRTTGFTHKNAAGATVGSGSYTLDAGDRVTAQTVNGDTRTFGYDKTGQLTNDTGTVYTYDKAGNRTGAGSWSGRATASPAMGRGRTPTTTPGR